MSPSAKRPRVLGKMARRLAAVSLLGQAMTVFFGGLVARQFEVAAGDPEGRANVYLAGGIGLALVCILASGLLRRPSGVWVGWGCQVLTLASALVLPAMAIVAVIFGGLWWLCLSQGRKMDELTARWAEQDDDPAGDDRPGPRHTDDRPKGT